MLARVIGDYGGVKVDARVVENPQSELAASEHNRLAEDSAQLTRTAHKGVVRFTTVGAGSPAANTVFHRSQWGTGDASKPTITRTAAGRYTLTYATSFDDAIGDTENVGLFDAHVTVRSSDPVDILTARTLTIGTNSLTMLVQAGGIDADVGDNSSVAFEVIVWMV